MDGCIGALLLFAAKERLPTLATPLWPHDHGRAWRTTAERQEKRRKDSWHDRMRQGQMQNE
jgi:hypothetical protein